VPYSTMIQAFAATRNSATNWLAKTENDTLQRIYGVSFPDKKELKKWQEFQEQVRILYFLNIIPYYYILLP
jgi:threonyl-tRNA synthetase